MHESIVTVLIRKMKTDSACMAPVSAPVPIWQPPDEPPGPRRAVDERPFQEHVSAVYQKFSPKLPPLKSLCDAMKLDGYPPEKIKQARDRHAKMNRTVDQRQTELEKMFGRYNSKTTKPVKKVLKVVKKRNAAAE
jgi:hypothetical protein